MKISTVLILKYVLFFVLFFGCNRAIYHKLYGNWITDDENGAVRMVFTKNGNVTIKYKEGVELTGTWVIDSNGNIQISMEIWDIQGTIEENKLILKNNNNSKAYRKIR